MVLWIAGGKSPGMLRPVQPCSEKEAKDLSLNG